MIWSIVHFLWPLFSLFVVHDFGLFGLRVNERIALCYFRITGRSMIFSIVVRTGSKTVRKYGFLVYRLLTFYIGTLWATLVFLFFLQAILSTGWLFTTRICINFSFIGWRCNFTYATFWHFEWVTSNMKRSPVVTFETSYLYVNGFPHLRAHICFFHTFNVAPT